MEAVDVTNEPHVNNWHSPYAPNPKLPSLEFHATFASTHRSICSLVFFYLQVDNFRDTPPPIDYFLWCTIAIVIKSHGLGVCTMHSMCFNIGHQIFLLSNWEVMFAFKFHLSSKGPPTNKKEVFASFALITCNVLSWNIWCVGILVGVNQGLYKCCKS